MATEPKKSEIPAQTSMEAMRQARPPTVMTRITWTRPVVWAPLVLGAVSVVGYFLLQASLLFLLLSVLSLGFFAVSFFVVALASKGIETERQRQLGWSSDEEKARGIRRLLGRAQYEEATGPWAERGVEQAEQAIAKMKAFQKVLGQKFEPHELTFSRYQETAREVYSSVLASLEQTGHILTGMATLKDGDLLRSQRKEVEQRLEQNEKGLSALDEVTAALARVDTGRGLSGPDLETALARLQELASRAEKYSKGRS